VTHPIKLIASALVLLLSVPAARVLAAESPLAAAAAKAGCEYSAVEDTHIFTCPLKAAKAEKRYRFKANFSGVHDDSMVSLIPLLNEQPLTCGPGSKTRFVGDEMGDSSLDCRFTVSASAGEKPVLKVQMKWSHAEHAGVELIAE
jgi:hypothetical protein